MASSGWQGDVTLQSGGFGYDYFKGNFRVDSIAHSGDTVTVSGAFGVHNAGGYSSYYVYPINAAVNGATGYQQVVAGNQWIATDEWVVSGVSFSFSAAATATSASIEVLWNYNNGTASNAITYTLYFDASVSPPTGLNVSGATTTKDSVTANVSISSWGVGSGTKYRELQVWTDGMVEPRRYQPVNGSATSGNITVANSSSGSLTIKPNTKYTLGGYASNGSMNTGSQNFGNVYTLPEEPMVDLMTTSTRSIVLGYGLNDQGGARTLYIDYKMSGDTDWTTAATITGAGEKSGTITIDNLAPNETYTINVRARSSAGWSAALDDIAATTRDVTTKMYCSANGVAKRVTKVYCSVGGQRKRVKKIYGSVNGQAKLVWEEA